MHFPKIVCQAIDGIRLLKDFVHAERIIGRYFEAAVRQVTLRHGEPQSETNRQGRLFEGPKGTSPKETPKQTQL